LKGMAYQYRGVVAFGEVRGSNPKLSERFGIRKYPTVVAFCGGDQYATIMVDDLSSEALPDFVADLVKNGERKCVTARREAAKKRRRVHEALDPSTDFSKMKLRELREILAALGSECVGCLEKADYVRKVREAVAA